MKLVTATNATHPGGHAVQKFRATFMARAEFEVNAESLSDAGIKAAADARNILDGEVVGWASTHLELVRLGEASPPE